jgi:hypothetical protein
MLKKLLPLDNIEMSLDFGVLTSEAFNGAVVEVTEVLFQNAGELIVEFTQQLRIEEQVRGRGELVSDSVEEDFGAVIFVLLVGTLAGFDGRKTHSDDVGAVAEEKGLSSLCKQSCTEASCAADSVTFEDHIAFSHTVDEADNVLHLAAASDLLFDNLGGSLTVVKLVLQYCSDVLAATLPLVIIKLNTIFVGLDADF